MTLFLPRLIGRLPAERTDCDLDGLVERASEGETVLLVEDDDGVRSYSAAALADLGYAVLESRDGEEAIGHLDGTGRIDLVFTDVVLTGALTGRDVADHARTARAGTPVLFTSGYARDAVIHDGKLDAGVDLLSKPFSLSQLAARIRMAIERLN